jgi:hypothetical protein
MAIERNEPRIDMALHAIPTGASSRWVVLIYLIIALGAPLLAYAGPELMPAAPLIADKALDGQFTLRILAARS